MIGAGSRIWMGCQDPSIAPVERRWPATLMIVVGALHNEDVAVLVDHACIGRFVVAGTFFAIRAALPAMKNRGWGGHVARLGGVGDLLLDQRPACSVISTRRIRSRLNLN
jgi:hypothetical protein